MSKVRASALLTAVSLLVFPSTPQANAELVLNEVLYDPAGPDEGLEFVELWNPDTVAVSLAGILLEAGDGARPGVWTAVYAGAAADSVGPRRAFLIPGSALTATLQNGPDAIRMSRGGSVLDLLGYGALAAPELYEEAPAEDAPSGMSLARVEDGRDTGRNAADWGIEPDPTPGSPNHPDVRLRIVRGSASIQPEVPWPGETAVLRLTVRNVGRLEVPALRWGIEVALRQVLEGGGDWTALPEGDQGLGAGAALAPGESTAVRCEITTPSPGRFDVRATLRGAAIADTIQVGSRSTAAPLVIQEIAFRDRGAGEWVELLARDAIPDLGAFALTDAGTRAYAIDRGPLARPVRAGEILVVAQSPALLRSAYSLPDSAVLGLHGGWPSLNDTDGDDGFADRVRVVDSLGIPCDAVPYRSEYAERRASIERLGIGLPSASPNTWAETVDPHAGTPGRPNSLSAPKGEGRPKGALLVASSRLVRRSAEAQAPVVLAFGESARGRKVRVVVHDLLGRVRRRLMDGQRVLSDVAFVWDGKDDEGAPVPAGIYVVRGETIPEGGAPATSGSLALTVVDRWPR
ncbi:MAG TPA: hypothetical protein VET83_10135 [Candidatus Dormibacteraeota bacterium]|nr:hypothetical protein [Candidatus Dormibacteraeota bacterium]